MITATDILDDAFTRVNEAMHQQLDGLAGPTVLWRPDAEANSIGWLAWHLTRVQDDHLAGVGDRDQVWTADGFAASFALPYPVEAHGYGHSSDDVAAFTIDDVDLLLAYHDAVHQMTLTVLGALDDAGYARVVDDSWDPPVTAAVRLVSVIGDTGAHLGQIGYLRGLAERRAS
ncbi:MAG: mycothiol transferase [Propioniciclava sp.]